MLLKIKLKGVYNQEPLNCRGVGKEIPWARAAPGTSRLPLPGFTELIPLGPFLAVRCLIWSGTRGHLWGKSLADARPKCQKPGRFPSAALPAVASGCKAGSWLSLHGGVFNLAWPALCWAAVGLVGQSSSLNSYQKNIFSLLTLSLSEGNRTKTGFSPNVLSTIFVRSAQHLAKVQIALSMRVWRDSLTYNFPN